MLYAFIRLVLRLVEPVIFHMALRDPRDQSDIAWQAVERCRLAFLDGLYMRESRNDYHDKLEALGNEYAEKLAQYPSKEDSR